MAFFESFWTNSFLPFVKQIGVLQIGTAIVFLLIIMLLFINLRMTVKCFALSRQLEGEVNSMGKRISTISNAAVRAERSEKFRGVEVQKKDSKKNNESNLAIVGTKETDTISTNSTENNRKTKTDVENEEIFRTFMQEILS